jgi:hypothetical protein
VDANEDDGYLVAWIRDEVERTWARTADYTFEGWGACDTLPEEGVVLSFESECRGHLVNDIDPTSKLVRLEICRSFYLEGRDELRPVDEPLARFLGRHHFGHVIGIPDNNYSGEPRTAMMRGIDLLRITEYEISPGELNWASEYCALGCRKHPGALVTTRGRCLEVVDGSVVARACADHEPGPQVFTLKGTKLVTADPEQCVVVSGDGEEAEVRVGECTAEQFALTGAALHSLGRCVTPASLPATPETALFIGACDAVPESWMGWSFDVTASTENGLLASIRHDGLCASIPGGADELNLVPVLRTCEEGSGEQIFELRHNGEIGFGDLCFAWEMHDGSVYLYSDCGRGYSVWTVTGALTTPSGLALTLPGDNATAKAIKAAPSQARTFDFYF